ncbi:hypothetical protein [Ferrimonas sp. YFM]|uniref:hypothetical protein n=1 Tax=Ferrimonas sp. YFM TaxID=3028878 RepID=UPI002573D5C8|nr:hypothetical protein [Ferrimonas sp. YFM]BDY05397.1 hypothetical protein F0521_24380 [Ferrimonas sp. YFM]
MNDQIALRLTQIGEQILKQQQVLAQATEWGPRDVVQAITAAAALVVPLALLWFQERKDKRRALANAQRAAVRSMLQADQLLNEASWHLGRVGGAYYNGNTDALHQRVDELDGMVTERLQAIADLLTENHIADDNVMQAYVDYRRSMKALIPSLAEDFGQKKALDVKAQALQLTKTTRQFVDVLKANAKRHRPVSSF